MPWRFGPFLKARQILRTHGVHGVLQRGSGKVRRDLHERVYAAAQRRAWRRLIRHARRTEPVYFPVHGAPLASIVIPVFNNVGLTATCLHSILRELGSIPCEVIVVDDASTDGTAAYLDRCSGVRVVRHAQNQGFLDSANDGAHAAHGRYICFLNNDTIVTPGWLQPLLHALQSDATVGAAGAQLRAPDGSISEAGAIVWRDASGMNFGRGKNASHPEFLYPRDVDYCSAACLMIRTDLFRELGGFAPEFRPGYYEDVDLCFRLRERGYRVRYQPDSVVIHVEGGTSGKDERAGMKRYQALNRALFETKWRETLNSHYAPDVRNAERAARRLQGARTVLVIDSFIPFDDRSAGGRRTLQIMRLMRELGWHVIFLADDGGEYEPYTQRARAAGIEVLPHRGDALDVLHDLPVHIDVAWISRPDLVHKYAEAVRISTGAQIVYDTVDLHFIRLRREAMVTGHATNWQAVREMELQLAREADCTVVTTEDERHILAAQGVDARVVPIIEASTPGEAPFEGRRDLLFLGNYTHEPNVDAALWLANAIMPLVWEQLPDVRLILAGADPNPPVQRLANDRISVTGYVPDIAHLFGAARLCVAPLRFGAGMKGKIVQSLAHGLPVVTTKTGAEGIGLIDGADALIADDAQEVADAIVRAYTDAVLWETLAMGARRSAERFTPQAVRGAVERALDQALLQREEMVGNDVRHPAHAP